MNARIRMIALCTAAAFAVTGCASIPIPFSGIANKLGSLFSGNSSAAKSAPVKSSQKSLQNARQKDSQKSLEKAMQNSADNSKKLQKKLRKNNSASSPKSLNISKKPQKSGITKRYHDIQGVPVR